jgi:hypothetical protein
VRIVHCFRGKTALNGKIGKIIKSRGLGRFVVKLENGTVSEFNSHFLEKVRVL